jgi:cytochrome P450
VKPSRKALPLLPFIARFIRNPLRSLPRAVYEQPIVLYRNRKNRPLVAWVMSPTLIETILLKESDSYGKTLLDKRIMRPIIGEGLLTSEGDAWKWQRKLASPLFRHSEILSYLPSMVAASHEQIAEWRDKGATHEAAIDNDMTETTFKIISRTVLAGIREDEGEAIKTAGRAYLEPISWEIAASMLLLKEGFWHPGRNRMRRAAVAERAAVTKLLERRRRETPDAEDLLARMLRARHPETGEPMPDSMLIDNLATFLLAGHETTAKALTWTLYLLARAPDWQKRVREEIVAVTGTRDVIADDLERLPITHRVLKEALRLYPPAPVLTRVNLKPVTLGGNRLETRTLIVLPVFAIHRHKTLWEDPDRFDPDRFLPEREARYTRTQFMPFGFGPRVCIGQAFAMIEAATVLATLIKSAEFSTDARNAPEPVSRVTLRPKGGMRLTVRML